MLVVLETKGFSLEFRICRFRYRDGPLVKLTAKEADIFAMLFETHGVCVGEGKLCKAIWPDLNTGIALLRLPAMVKNLKKAVRPYHEIRIERVADGYVMRVSE